MAQTRQAASKWRSPQLHQRVRQDAKGKDVELVEPDLATVTKVPLTSSSKLSGKIAGKPMLTNTRTTSMTGTGSLGRPRRVPDCQCRQSRPPRDWSQIRPTPESMPVERRESDINARKCRSGISNPEIFDPLVTLTCRRTKEIRSGPKTR